jgi:hypothetical protein
MGEPRADMDAVPLAACAQAQIVMRMARRGRPLLPIEHDEPVEFRERLRDDAAHQAGREALGRRADELQRLHDDDRAAVLAIDLGETGRRLRPVEVEGDGEPADTERKQRRPGDQPGREPSRPARVKVCRGASLRLRRLRRLGTAMGSGSMASGAGSGGAASRSSRSGT